MRLEQIESREELTFDSWGDFLEFSQKRTKAVGSVESSRSGINNRDFSGVDNFEEAVSIANEGWSEGASKIKALSQVIMDKVTSMIEKNTIQFDVTGNDFDMAAYLQGVPEHWYRMESHFEEGKGTKVLRLVYNQSASCGVDKDVMTAKGAAVVSLVGCLEASGFRVELLLRSTSKRGDAYRIDTLVPIKAADQPIEIDRIAFAIAHPASFRRLMFSVWESSPAFVANCNFGYGHPTDMLPQFKGDITIEKSFLGEPQWTDAASASAWVLQTLKEQGVQIVEGSRNE